MSELLIFDQHDNLLTVLSNDAEGACPFWNAPFRETLNNVSEFQFTAPADHEDSQHIVGENQVAFLDKDNVFRLFVIKEPEYTNGENGPQILAICEPALLELNDEIIEDKRPYDTTAEDALIRALEGCRWQAGQVDELGLSSTNFYYITVNEAVSKVAEAWGGELRDRVIIEDNRITGRYIDILVRRGADTGKIWEIDKDILSITHKVKSYPKTALYGRGSSLEITDEEGHATGGFTRKITFADVEWSTANGDPVDKPLGREWVGDQEALQIYGRKNADGTLRHRVGVFESNEQKDPISLLQETWEALQEQKHPISNYTMDVFLLEEISGYEHEKVRIGDTTIAIDRSFAKPIEVEERVIVYEYDVADPDNTGHVELGQYIDLYEETARLEKIESKLNERAPVWDRGPEKEPITDEDFPDTVPDTPANFTTKGLFNNINLKWDYDHSSFIAAYEVYGSQIQGFTADPSNLLWRGKSSGFNHEATSNQQWYFRLRAINTHGTPSEFTEEMAANTVTINAQTDITPLTVTNELIAADVSADKIVTGILRAITLQGVNIVGSVFESENGNFRADDNGITLKNMLAKTTLTTDGLTGWWDATGNEDYEKIFYFSEDETVSKKFRAKNEFTMGNIKIVKVDFGGNKGWAFVPTVEVID